jgi:hypothetical protein
MKKTLALMLILTYSLTTFAAKKPKVAQQDVTGVFFVIGGYNEGYDNYEIEKTEDGAEVRFYNSLSNRGDAVRKTLKAVEWSNFSRGILDCNIAKWKEEYKDRKVLDGTQWNLRVTFEDADTIEVSGSNKYPKEEEWRKLRGLFNRLGMK